MILQIKFSTLLPSKNQSNKICCY